jgi:multimeric flavodoxin WrbA
MNPLVLGISGSPIKNSNTDRMIRAILESTGQPYEFVKLSRINVRPCIACKLCVPDNICKVKDDFPALAEKVKAARALVIGAYTPYKQIDGFTKALLERFWSLRHRTNLLKGKMGVTVLTGLSSGAIKSVNHALAAELQTSERMDLLGQVTIKGNLPCLTCNYGDECEMSGISSRFGPDVRAADVMYCRVEDQQEVWDEALRLGQLIGERIRAEQSSGASRESQDGFDSPGLPELKTESSKQHL